MSYYARFVWHQSCIRGDASIRPEVFLDKRPPHNTSVNEHEIFKNDIHWDEGRSVNPQCGEPLGAADISQVDIENVPGMTVVRTYGENEPEHHAEIRGWDMRDDDEGKHARKEKARSLADAAVWVPNSRT